MTDRQAAHLDLLCSDGVTVLRDPDGPLRRASPRSLGPVSFEGLVVGDLLCGDAGALRWPVGSPMPTEAEAFVLAVEWEADHERISAVGLRFSKAPVARWVACDAGAGVDSGTAGFASESLRSALEEDESLFEEFEAKDSWGGVVLSREGRSIVLASSGWGDGVYDAYWGMTEDGAPAWVALDFDVLSCPVFDEVSVPLPLSRGRRELFPGVVLEVGLFRRGTPKLRTALPTGQYAYVRVRTPGGLVAPTPTWGGVGGTCSFAVAAVEGGTELLVRRVTHHAPMPLAEVGEAT